MSNTKIRGTLINSMVMELVINMMIKIKLNVRKFLNIERYM